TQNPTLSVSSEPTAWIRPGPLSAKSSRSRSTRILWPLCSVGSSRTATPPCPAPGTPPPADCSVTRKAHCLSRTECRLELYKLLGIVSEVEPFLVRNRAYPPLLHGQRAKQNLDGLTVFVFADFLDQHGVR